MSPVAGDRTGGGCGSLGAGAGGRRVPGRRRWRCLAAVAAAVAVAPAGARAAPVSVGAFLVVPPPPGEAEPSVPAPPGGAGDRGARPSGEAPSPDQGPAGGEGPPADAVSPSPAPVGPSAGTREPSTGPTAPAPGTVEEPGAMLAPASAGPPRTEPAPASAEAASSPPGAPAFRPVSQGPPADARGERGSGMLAAGAALGITFFVARDLATGLAVALGGGVDFLWFMQATVATPLEVLSGLPVGLVAAGAWRRGRYDAWHGPRPGLSMNRLRQRARVGWTFLGIGTGLTALSAGLVVAQSYADSDAVWFGLTYGRFGLSLLGEALTVAGLSIGPYAGGLRAGLRERRGGGLSLAPTLVRGGPGVVVFGRF